MAPEVGSHVHVKVPERQRRETPYQRQKGRKCELEVVPFGEKVMYRLPEVASERHQALEERWAKGMWLGHARHSPEVLIGIAEGIVKSWAIRRLPEDQQWDGEMVKNTKGSPTNWRLDAGEDSQLVEVEDRDSPEPNPELAEREGQRTEERKAM